MKRYPALLAILVSLLTFACTNTSEKIKGTWVLEMTRTEMIKTMTVDGDMTEAVAESMIGLLYPNISFPAVVYKMVFTDASFNAYVIYLTNGIEQPAGSGAYRVEGRTVTLIGGSEPMIGTISGNKLTFKVNSEEMVLKKK